jgi:hypothetical protein
MIKPTHLIILFTRTPVRKWLDKHGLHRHAGPAIESSSGSKYWWWHGRFVSRDSGEQPAMTEVFPHEPPAKDFPGYEACP